MSKGIKFNLIALVLAATVLTAGPALAAAKNVFVMISDGASFGAWDAADLYTSGSTTSSIYYGAEFKKYLSTTYPLNTKSTPQGTNIQDPSVIYNSSKAWDNTVVSGNSAYASGYPAGFNAYEYLRQTPTDSAAAATAMATGQKTYNNAINWSDTGKPIKTIIEYAQDAGKATGTITSVEWSHATPAGFSDAHNVSRNDYVGIANAMLNGKMDVIMGAGNPQYSDNGIKTVTDYKTVTDSQARYVGGQATWIQLNEGTHAGGWTLVQSKSDFEALANKSVTMPSRVVGVAEAATTLQQARSGYNPNDTVAQDVATANANVPNLVTMTQAAVNVLGAKSEATGDKGFFLQIEGGAVDWAAHANQDSRLIAEQIDFNNTVNWVVSWIKNNGGWDDNLLIITTDHANSMPSGSTGDFMARVVETDVNGVPTIQWYSGDHMNQLVPLFVAGAGSEMFDTLVDGVDNGYGTDPNKKGFIQYYSDWYKAGFDGRYVDNTDMFYVMRAQVAATPIPGSVLLLGSGMVGLLFIGLRRRFA